MFNLTGDRLPQSHTGSANRFKQRFRCRMSMIKLLDVLEGSPLKIIS